MSIGNRPMRLHVKVTLHPARCRVILRRLRGEIAARVPVGVQDRKVLPDSRPNRRASIKFVFQYNDRV